MTDDEKKLYELFAQKKGLAEQEPSFVAAFGPSSESLERGEAKARDTYRQGPELGLDDTQRQGLGGQRFPDLQGVAELFILALGKHPEIVSDIGAAPELWDRIVRLDQGLGRFLWAGQLLWRGGESGELITGASAQGLCQGILKDADGRKDDPALPMDQRSTIACAFTEAQRIDDERKARAAQVNKATDQGTRPYDDQISQAEENAAMSRVIDGFLANQEQNA